MINTYISVDVETTGLHVKNDKIIEIGAVKVINGEIKESFLSFTNAGKEISEGITKLTGITNEDMKDAPTIQEAIRKFVEFAEDLPLLGHSIMFDYAFLKRAAVNADLGFEKSGIDTLKIARKFLAELESRKLENLCRHYGIEHNAHRALDDAAATHALYQRMAEQFGKDASFEPLPLHYRVKKEAPAMRCQKQRLYELISQHNLKVDYDVQMLTKNEASRYTDRILAEYGR